MVLAGCTCEIDKIDTHPKITIGLAARQDNPQNYLAIDVLALPFNRPADFIAIFHYVRLASDRVYMVNNCLRHGEGRHSLSAGSGD